ncbi:MAG: thiamine pyrophosphate-binding protein, partial [Methyloligellaceae bacterium]
QEEMFRPLTKWNGYIDRAERLPLLVRAAFRAMTTGRTGAAHLALPFDVQRAPVPEDEIWIQPEFARFPAWRSAPDPASVERAADLLLASKAPIVIAGGGVVLSGGEAALQAIAECLDIAVATTISGQGSLSESHPNCLGVVGSNGGTPQTRALTDEADLVIFIGCRAGSVTTERWRHPRRGVKVVHIDVDPMAISANYATDEALVGDARLALEALQSALDDRLTHAVSFGASKRVKQARQEKSNAFEALARSSDRPIRPERLVAALNGALPDDAVIVADPGTPCPYFSAFYEFRRPGRHFITNRAHGALGYALPASMGAQLGRPDAPVISVMGDGSFGFTSGELETVVRLNLPVTFVVVSNATYGWIKAGQKSGFEERYFSVDFNRTDHAAVAASYGLRSWRVEDPSSLSRDLGAAISHDGPALVDVVTQPLHEANAPVSEWVA